MKYRVSLVEAAELDLLDIHLYVELNDTPRRADDLIDKLEQTIFSLADMPERGHYPQELERIGIREYREIHYKPYRIIYTIQGRDVIVHCVLDGRRDMQTLLHQRLLR
ncbi:MAG TPA: type II toxin-antitoxin system RelE/ParE family toxin [Geobacteraceae bacterium]|jgi:toxin ParE1/3/4|nr:type II toxin-antitoxin system RelE/ParE family toxin [Geobacteraceae bacterium]